MLKHEAHASGRLGQAAMEPQEPVLQRVRELLQEPPGGECDQLVELLGRRVRALREGEMRRASIRVFFDQTDDAGLVAALERIWEGCLLGRPAERELLQELALDGCLLRELAYDRITDLYEVAARAGLTEVLRMFLGEMHRGNPSQDETELENEHLALPAGVRRAAARGRDRFVLDRILHDRNPRVIRALLENPRIVEQDVVRVAAMRPTRPEVLRVIADHPRWSGRYVVRKALVSNPYTPTPVAVRLASTLLVQDLHEILEAVPLPAMVREAIEDVLARRRPPPPAR
jgi:hypothetical protein